MQSLKLITALISISIFISCQSEKEKLSAQIKENESQLFNDSTRMLDPAIANKTLMDYEKFANAYPEDTSSAGYLFRAADLAHGMKKSHDAVRLYKLFISKYPQHQKAAASYFL